jgi:hypothetical protein
MVSTSLSISDAMPAPLDWTRDIVVAAPVVVKCHDDLIAAPASLIRSCACFDTAALSVILCCTAPQEKIVLADALDKSRRGERQ